MIRLFESTAPQLGWTTLDLLGVHPTAPYRQVRCDGADPDPARQESLRSSGTDRNHRLQVRSKADLLSTNRSGRGPYHGERCIVTGQQGPHLREHRQSGDLRDARVERERALRRFDHNFIPRYQHRLQTFYDLLTRIDGKFRPHYRETCHVVRPASCVPDIFAGAHLRCRPVGDYLQ